MQKPFTFQAYDFTLPAGGSQAILAGGEYFRILSATGALDVTVEGKGTMPDLLAGQAFKNMPFQRLVLRDKSGAPNSGYILVSSSEFVDNRMFGTFDLSPTALAALESIDLNPATLASLSAMRRPLAPTGSYGSNSIGAASATTIFTAASNTNGAIVLNTSIVQHGIGLVRLALLAKSTAPASTTDGEVLMATAGDGSFNDSTPKYVAAGLGLHFYASESVPSTNGFRGVRYILL